MSNPRGQAEYRAKLIRKLDLRLLVLYQEMALKATEDAIKAREEEED